MTITRENAKQHCRTCLCSLSVMDLEDEKTSMDDMALIQEAIAALIFKDLEMMKESRHGCPKRLCLRCHTTVQHILKFQQMADDCTTRLNIIFNDSVQPKIECDLENSGHDSWKLSEDVADQLAPNKDLTEDFYKFLLMQTESVQLDSGQDQDQALDSTDKTLVDEETGDPFEVALESISISKTTDMETVFSKTELSANGKSRKTRKNVKTVTTVKKKRNDTKHGNLKSRNLRSNAKLRSTVKSQSKKKKSILQSQPIESTVPSQSEETSTSIVNSQTEKKNPSRVRIRPRKKIFKCDKCPRCFSQKMKRDAHVRKVHEGVLRPYECDRCDKTYSFYNSVLRHIRETHDAPNTKFACDQPGCDRIYTTISGMQQHKRFKHNIIDQDGRLQYICELCGITFNTLGNFNYHRRRKHPTDEERIELEKAKSERFECTECKKSFHTRYTLKYHTLRLHSQDSKYACNVCGRKVAKKFMLAQHMLVHSGEKLTCDQCGREFVRKFQLEAHIRAVHMGLKPFSCQYCSECFATRKTRRHHEYIHTGEKPYVCDICGQAYRQQTCLKNHRKGHDKSGTLTTTNKAIFTSTANDAGEKNSDPPPSIALTQ